MQHHYSADHQLLLEVRYTVLWRHLGKRLSLWGTSLSIESRALGFVAVSGPSVKGCKTVGVMSKAAATCLNSNGTCLHYLEKRITNVFHPRIGLYLDHFRRSSWILIIESLRIGEIHSLVAVLLKWCDEEEGVLEVRLFLRQLVAVKLSGWCVTPPMNRSILG